MKWIVDTCDQTWEGEAEDAFSACVEAVKSTAFQSIGQLMQARPEGVSEDDDNNVFYCSGERVCEASGLLKRSGGEQGGEQK